MNRKRLATTAGCVLGALIGSLALASSAQATGNIPVKSACFTDWYVNPDEGALAPSQLAQGFLFDGPSLVHHATSLDLADLTAGSFATVGSVTGVRPLFKVETGAPYSTVNITAAGKFWSSRIVAGDGSQSAPVSSAAELIGKWNYTAATKVNSFGVGYANDTGNRAVVGAITFKGSTYFLNCKPVAPHPTKPPVTRPIPHPTNTHPGVTQPPGKPVGTRPPTVAPSTSPTPIRPSTRPATSPSSTTGAGIIGASTDLPLTGSSVPVALIVGGGIAALILGAGVFAVARRRKVDFTA